MSNDACVYDISESAHQTPKISKVGISLRNRKRHLSIQVESFKKVDFGLALKDFKDTNESYDSNSEMTQDKTTESTPGTMQRTSVVYQLSPKDYFKLNTSKDSSPSRKSSEGSIKISRQPTTMTHKSILDLSPTKDYSLRSSNTAKSMLRTFTDKLLTLNLSSAPVCNEVQETKKFVTKDILKLDYQIKNAQVKVNMLMKQINEQNNINMCLREDVNNIVMKLAQFQ